MLRPGQVGVVLHEQLHVDRRMRGVRQQLQLPVTHQAQRRFSRGISYGIYLII
jgi:hypothetical protein